MPRTSPHIPAKYCTFCTLYAPGKGQFSGAMGAMILNLDDQYRIVSDEHNFTLQKKMDPKKNPRKGREAKKATEQWKNPPGVLMLPVAAVLARRAC